MILDDPDRPARDRYPLEAARARLLLAVETIPAMDPGDAQTEMCDLATNVALDCSRAAARTGLLDMSTGLRMVARAIVTDPPLTIGRAGAIHAAVQSCSRPDALARVPALLA